MSTPPPGSSWPNQSAQKQGPSTGAGDVSTTGAVAGNARVMPGAGPGVFGGPQAAPPPPLSDKFSGPPPSNPGQGQHGGANAWPAGTGASPPSLSDKFSGPPGPGSGGAGAAASQSLQSQGGMTQAQAIASANAALLAQQQQSNQPITIQGQPSNKTYPTIAAAIAAGNQMFPPGSIFYIVQGTLVQGQVVPGTPPAPPPTPVQTAAQQAAQAAASAAAQGLTGATAVIPGPGSPPGATAGVLVPQTQSNQVLIYTQNLALLRAQIAQLQSFISAPTLSGGQALGFALLYPNADPTNINSWYSVQPGYPTPQQQLASWQGQVPGLVSALQSLGVANP